MGELTRPAWMLEPEIRMIPQEKLDFLQKMVFESRNLSQRELFSFLMSMAQRSKNASVTFTQEEMGAIVSAIRKHSTPEELIKINQLLMLVQSRRK